MEIGAHFKSYDELVKRLNEFCKETNSRFWKRDARTIGASRMGSGLHPIAVNSALRYYEVKFICIHGGQEFKSRAVMRFRPHRPKTGCPAYLRFRVSEDGASLMLVAMNLKHNHEPLEDAESSLVQRRKRELEDNEEEESDTKKFILESESLSKENILMLGDNLDENVELIELYVDEETSPQVNFTFKGHIVPVLTPFNDDQEKSLNLDIIPTYAKFLNESGITGILVNGTSGEGMSMNVDERKLVAEAWLQAAKTTKQHVMVQIGGTNLPDVLELAQHAEVNGANSLLCLPELYNKPTTNAQLINYLKIVGQAAPNTPLLLYHIPSFTHVNLDMGEFLNEIPGKVPTFVGIKYTDKNMEQGYRAIKANDEKFSVFLGCDQVMAGAFVLGFDSAIATTLNMFPHLGLGILNSVQNGNVEEARHLQNTLNTAIGIVTRNGAWVETMKEAMSILTPISCGPPRDPLRRLSTKQIKQMEIELKTIAL